MSLRKQIISGSAWVLFGRVTGALIGLIFYSLLTRTLAPEDVGTYFLALSIATAFTAVVGLGLPRTATRLLAEATSGAIRHDTRNMIKRAAGLTLVAGSLCSIVYVTTLGEWLAQTLFSNPRLTSLNGYIAAWFFLLALRQLFAESFRGLGDIRLASVFGGLVSGGIATALLGSGALVMTEMTIGHALAYTLAGLLVSTALALMLLWRATTPGSKKEGVHTNQILAIAAPIMLTDIIQAVLAQSNTWILGGVATEAEVALYGTVMQIVLLISFPFIVVNNAIPQLLVKFKVAGQHDKLEMLLQGVATATFLPALLLAVCLAFLGRPLLELVYGPTYGAGAPALVWLAAGQLVNVVTGPCGIALMLTGHQRVSMAVNIATGLIAIPLAFYLGARYGAAGTAASAALAMSGQNISLAVLAHRRIGVRTHVSFSRRILRQFRPGKRA
ncbi:MAG: oligosaccharide flippase family protein [Pseudomonadota bacterium]